MKSPFTFPQKKELAELQISCMVFLLSVFQRMTVIRYMIVEIFLYGIDEE